MQALPSGREMADRAVEAGAIDMAQGVVHRPPPPLFLEVLMRLFPERRVHVYASPAGYRGFREALLAEVQREQASLTLDHLMATNGVSGGITAALRAHCGPLDHVLLLEPFYPAHHWAIQSLNLVTEFVAYSDAFTLDWEAIKKALPRVKAFLLANPANPTGTVLGAHDLERLYSLCREHDVLLIIDEVYRDFVWEGEYHSLLEVTPDLSHVVVLRSFSKNLALAGWRCGYAVAEPERRAAMTQVHEAFYVGAPAPAQFVMAELLTQHATEVEAFVAETVRQYRGNRTLVTQAFTQAGMEPILKEGAYYLLVRHNRASDMAAMQELLERGVAVAPGVPFFKPGTQESGFIRAHFALGADDLNRAIALIGQ